MSRKPLTEGQLLVGIVVTGVLTALWIAFLAWLVMRWVFA